MSEIKWIPVNERFPEDPGTYLVTYKSRGEKFVTTLHFSEDELDYYDNYIERIFRGYDVIAWAYMPAPYKED